MDYSDRLLVKQYLLSMHFNEMSAWKDTERTLREGSAFCISLDLGRTQKGGHGLSELTGKSMNIKFMLTLLKWFMPADMTPKREPEILPKFGRCLSAVFSQPFDALIATLQNLVSFLMDSSRWQRSARCGTLQNCVMFCTLIRQAQ